MSYPTTPLLFNLWEDPSEAYPLTPVNNASTAAEQHEWKRNNPHLQPVLDAIQAAHDHEVATFTHGSLVSPPGTPAEKQPDGTFLYAVCCDRAKDCDCDGKPSSSRYAEARQLQQPWFADLQL